jgi:hypothetical protein
MAAQTPPALTCAGGSIGTGTYASITVTGFCNVVPYAEITVVGNLNVGAGAFFDAQSVPSTITVGHNVTAATGSLMGLGCQPDHVDSHGNHYTGHPCGVDPENPENPNNPYANDSSAITVNGNVTTTGANTVLLNGITVMGNITLTGGGGDIPWSIKNNTIGRNITASNIVADWFGALFNDVGGNMTLTNITATDPEDEVPPVYVVRNTIGRNLNCSGLGPALSFGFYPGQANTVGHQATGQCTNPVST